MRILFLTLILFTGFNTFPYANSGQENGEAGVLSGSPMGYSNLEKNSSPSVPRGDIAAQNYLIYNYWSKIIFPASEKNKGKKSSAKGTK